MHLIIGVTSPNGGGLRQLKQFLVNVRGSGTPVPCVSSEIPALNRKKLLLLKPVFFYAYYSMKLCFSSFIYPF